MSVENCEIPEQSVQSDFYAREKVFLANQELDGVKVLPGKEWAFHYPGEVGARSAAIASLLSGQTEPGDVAVSLRPDAFTYNAGDLETVGLQPVVARVRDVATAVRFTDYHQMASFFSELVGTGVTIERASSLYTGITGNRTRQRMLESYGSLGRAQMREALKIEGKRIVECIQGLSGIEKVLAVLSMDWLVDEVGVATGDQREQVMRNLSSSDLSIFQKAREIYRTYVTKGDQGGYRSLVLLVKENLQAESRAEHLINQLEEQPSAEGEGSADDEADVELERELDPFREQAVPPGMPGDPAIPPEDSDEYHTPPVPKGESGEGGEQVTPQPFYEITPSGTSTEPLVGYYASGRKSYYDVNSRTWSKRKVLSTYGAVLTGDERQTISGVIEAGLRSVPIPNGYGLDMSSLRYSGTAPEILRDQNGCFYIKSSGSSAFAVDFLREDQVFVGPPVQEDLELLHRGPFSAETEQILQGLSGSTLERAEQIRRYLLSKHFYPGDGDVLTAQALQLKLRSESTGDTYIQTLEESEYLECYSANTLYIAMLRSAKIPARLVVGHKVEGATDGKAVISAQTGHAWTEVWDGSAWRRIDATPRLKHKKNDDGVDSQSPTKQADDGGIDRQEQDQGPRTGTRTGTGTRKLSRSRIVLIRVGKYFF